MIQLPPAMMPRRPEGDLDFAVAIDSRMPAAPPGRNYCQQAGLVNEMSQGCGKRKVATPSRRTPKRLLLPHWKHLPDLFTARLPPVLAEFKRLGKLHRLPLLRSILLRQLCPESIRQRLVASRHARP